MLYCYQGVAKIEIICEVK